MHKKWADALHRTRRMHDGFVGNFDVALLSLETPLMVQDAPEPTLAEAVAWLNERYPGTYSPTHEAPVDPYQGLPLFQQEDPEK